MTMSRTITTITVIITHHCKHLLQHLLHQHIYKFIFSIPLLSSNSQRSRLLDLTSKGVPCHIGVRKVTWCLTFSLDPFNLTLTMSRKGSTLTLPQRFSRAGRVSRPSNEPMSVRTPLFGVRGWRACVWFLFVCLRLGGLCLFGWLSCLLIFILFWICFFLCYVFVEFRLFVCRCFCLSCICFFLFCVSWFSCFVFVDIYFFCPVEFNFCFFVHFLKFLLDNIFCFVLISFLSLFCICWCLCFAYCLFRFVFLVLLCINIIFFLPFHS